MIKSSCAPTQGIVDDSSSYICSPSNPSVPSDAGFSTGEVVYSDDTGSSGDAAEVVAICISFSNMEDFLDLFQ